MLLFFVVVVKCSICIAAMECESYEFECHSGMECINGDYRCDGQRDCIDGSDEYNCRKFFLMITISHGYTIII